MLSSFLDAENALGEGSPRVPGRCWWYSREGSLTTQTAPSVVSRLYVVRVTHGHGRCFISMQVLLRLLILQFTERAVSLLSGFFPLWMELTRRSSSVASADRFSAVLRPAPGLPREPVLLNFQLDLTSRGRAGEGSQDLPWFSTHTLTRPLTLAGH